MRKLLRHILPFAILTLPFIASAHEVYVLDSASIARDVAAVSPNPFEAFYTNKFQFFFWGFVVFVGFSTIFFMSIFHRVEEYAMPFFRRLKPFAPLIERLTLGLSLMAFAYNGALFGPELPLLGIFGSFSGLAQILLYLTGALITLGLRTREAAFLVGLVAICAIPVHGWYMLTYTAYFVVAGVICIMGGGAYSLDYLMHHTGPLFLVRLRARFEKYEMLALRIGFGTSVIVAAVYAKFLHSALALDVVVRFHLTDYFHFEPLFIVLGALIIETLIGLLIIFGVELRWTAIFFLFWLTLSLLYFGEGVWPHAALFGLNFMLFFHGYDRYTVEGYFFKKKYLEPVL